VYSQMTTETSPPERSEAIQELLDEFYKIYTPINSYRWLREQLDLTVEKEQEEQEPPF
jgi:hypothetical protein